MSNVFAGTYESHIYDKFVKGLTDVTISMAAGVGGYSYPANTNFV
jgi:hypothetical protein